MMQIYFQKHGSLDWSEFGLVRTLQSFNKDFENWISKYYNDEQNFVESWDEALEVLNTVGQSSKAGIFKIEKIL